MAASDQATVLEDVVHYAPIRLVISGLFNLFFGSLFFGVAGIVVYAVWWSYQPHTQHIDPAPWPLVFAAVIPFLLSLPGLSAALKRLVGAFARGCYLRAGRQGIELRMPTERYAFRFRIERRFLAWPEIKDVQRHVFKINGIPTSSSLRLAAARRHQDRDRPLLFP